MESTIRNALIAGVSVLVIASFFAFVQVDNYRDRIAEAENLELSELLDDPARYDSLEVAVSGYLSWHPDEPTLFASESARRELNFNKSIQFETSNDVDYQFADEKPVIASGLFFFDAEYGRGLHNYKGILRVQSIAVAGDEQG